MTEMSQWLICLIKKITKSLSEKKAADTLIYFTVESFHKCFIKDLWNCLWSTLAHVANIDLSQPIVPE